MRVCSFVCLAPLLALSVSAAAAQSSGGSATAGASRDLLPSRDVLAPASGPGHHNGGWFDRFYDDGYGYRMGSSWLYPSVGVSVAFDDNIFAQRSKTVSDEITKLNASVVGRQRSGIHDLFGYAAAEGRIYANNSDLDAVDVTAGFIDRYEVRKDLLIRLQLEYAHRNELPGFGAVGLTAPLSGPLGYDQGYAALSFNQDLGRAYWSGGVTTTLSHYGTAKDLNGLAIDESYRNGTVTTVVSRLGYFIGPMTSVFVDPSYNWRVFDTTKIGGFDSQGGQVTAGIAVDYRGYLHGEIFGGYGFQRFESASLGGDDSVRYGGRLNFTPAQAFSINASLEQNYGETAYRPGTLSPLFGSVARTTVAQAQVLYGFAARWTLSATGSYEYDEFLSTNRTDDIWRGGVGVSVDLGRNFVAGVSYQRTAADSTVPSYGFDRNEAMFNLKGRF